MAASYATVEDYELRTGVDVPEDQELVLQTRLDDISALMELYMGECADEVATAHAEILTILCVGQAYAIAQVPIGVRSESVAGTSVTYADGGGSSTRLPTTMTDILDELMERVCGPSAELPGAGTVGAAWGGPHKPSDTAWMRDVDVWVV